MRKEDLSGPAIIAEAVGIICLVIYIALQIIYGVSYHLPASRILMNVLMAFLVYLGLTLMSLWPEKVNAIPKEICKGKIRIYTLRMLRVEKILFIISLLIPCVTDAFGKSIDGAYSLITIVLMAIVAIVYEVKIVRQLKQFK